MKKSFKGFTLIECMIALAILGVASLTMAQIYGAVSTRNKMNHLVNSSLSNQMSYVERYTNSQAVPMYFGGGATSTKDPEVGGTTKKPPHVADPNGTNLQKPHLKVESSYKDPVTGKKNLYSYSADIYVLKSRDRWDDTLDSSTKDGGYTEGDYNLRYKYVLGHKNS